MSKPLNELLYSSDECPICDGDGSYQDGEICECCGGTGFRFTPLGEAVWELALASRRSHAV